MKRFFAEFYSTLRRGVGLFLFRRQSPDAPEPRPLILVLTGGLWLLSFAVLAWLLEGEGARFNEFGLNTQLANWIVFLIAVALFSIGVRRAPLSRAFADVVTISLIGHVLALGLAGGSAYAGISLESDSHAALAMAAGILLLAAWQLAAIWRAGPSVFPATVRRPGLKLLAATLLPLLVIPDRPIFIGTSTPELRFDIWSWADTYRMYFPPEETETAEAEQPLPDYEAALFRQPAMVESALATILPSPGNAPQFYFVGAAPSSYHSVFKREVESARAIFAERFGAAGRSLSLISDVETWHDVPLASMTNLGRILDGMGQKMDRDRDVLVLFITSHGAAGELQVHFPGAFFNPMTGEGLASALTASGIKNRVIIVSACHSGSLIPMLEGPRTLILTAAHADKTSFGCSNDRDWTYFGDAYFNHALRETHSFTEAFEKAKALIAQWEKEQGITPSEPQMSAGQDILAKLDAMTDQMVRNRQADAANATPLLP